MDVKVENMVACITLENHLDLNRITKEVKGIENPKSFPGLIYRLKEMKVSFLIFRTGKLICSGARKRKSIDEALDHIIAKLSKVEPITGKPKVEVVNMVCSADLGFMVFLDKIAIESWNVEYEPEQFPGLVYRLDEPKAVMLIFRSGKMIVTGAKTNKMAKIAAQKTKEMVIELDAVLPGK